MKIEEISEIDIPKDKKNNLTESLDAWMHTKYRSLLGKINWIQSRTRFDACYDFSRCASKAASPNYSDLRDLNTLCRKIRAKHIALRYWPLVHDASTILGNASQSPWRIVGYPDAGYQNNKPDKSSQRGQCLFLCEPRCTSRIKQETHVHRYDARGSLIDYESHKIKKTVLSTTVAELYALMKCFGTCLFMRGLLMDLIGQMAEVHIRTDAKNLVTTAQTTHTPEQKETMHMIQMLRHDAC